MAGEWSLLRDVCTLVGVAVLLGKAEVDYVHDIGPVFDPNDEIVRLDVAVDEVPVVDELQASEELDPQHHRRLHGEFPSTVVEEILQTRTQKIHHDNRIVTDRRLHVDFGNTHSTFQDGVHLGFQKELGILGFRRLLLDSIQFARSLICTEVDVTKRTVTDFGYRCVVTLELLS